MFRLTDVPITQEPMLVEAAGGFVTFEGKVRNHAMGRSVIRLEYEAFPDLAIPEGVALLEEAKAKYGLLSASVIHRTGLLEVGDTAVLIQVAAAHRHEAFAGCEWIIDQLKHRVPIWKKEHFADGDSGWVGADVPSPNEDLYRALVQRQRSTEEVGEVGQTAIREAKVLMVGVGG